MTKTNTFMEQAKDLNQNNKDVLCSAEPYNVASYKKEDPNEVESSFNMNTCIHINKLATSRFDIKYMSQAYPNAVL